MEDEFMTRRGDCRRCSARRLPGQLLTGDGRPPDKPRSESTTMSSDRGRDTVDSHTYSDACPKCQRSNRPGTVVARKLSRIAVTLHSSVAAYRSQQRTTVLVPFRFSQNLCGAP
jgi:hypothetical protein